MADEEKKLPVQWEWKFGPASILAIVQLFVILGAGVWFFEDLKNGQATNSTDIARLSNADERQRSSIQELRNLANETKISITRIETKMDMLLTSSPGRK